MSSTHHGDRPSKKRRLSWDNSRDAYTCRRRGWRIDNDGWWYRKRKKDEPEFRDGAMGFSTERRVVARSASEALKHDRQCA